MVRRHDKTLGYRGWFDYRGFRRALRARRLTPGVISRAASELGAGISQRSIAYWCDGVYEPRLGALMLVCDLCDMDWRSFHVEPRKRVKPAFGEFVSVGDPSVGVEDMDVSDFF